MLELSKRNTKTVTTVFHVFKKLCRDMESINTDPNQIPRDKKRTQWNKWQKGRLVH